jgi:hypothetical protein
MRAWSTKWLMKIAVRQGLKIRFILLDDKTLVKVK